jgi:hypothetical protein
MDHSPQPLLTLSTVLRSLLAIAGVGAACAAHANELDASLPRNMSVATSSEIVVPVAPFKYVPSPRWVDPNPADVSQRTAEQQRILELYNDGKYAQAGVDGLKLMKTEKLDEQLQLYVANSLAWTNGGKEAGQLYRILQEGKYKLEAKVGLANLHRWTDRNNLAQPLYLEVLAVDPDNKEATEGMRFVNRELKPKTTVTGGGMNDSTHVRLRSLKLNHRWTDESLANVWEVEGGTVQNNNLIDQAKRQAITVRYSAMDTIFRPKIELGSDGRSIFGNLGLALGSLPVLIDVGKVNWGELANNPKALAQNLSANRIGAKLTAKFDAGDIFARADYYSISDGNTIATSTLRYTPSWRPLGAHFKPFIGMETRTAKFNTLSYWSPSDGYGSAFAGVLAEFEGADWNLYASAQGGVRLFGEAGHSWGASAGGKRWITNDWALGLKLWAMSSQRDNLPYRARSAYLTVEKLWN